MIRWTPCLAIVVMCTHVLSDPMRTPIDLRHELLTEVLGRYRLASRQIHESQLTLPFEIQFLVHDILQVDGASNEYRLRATIQLSYQLELLQWDANDTRNRYYDIDQVVLQRTVLQSLWLPDIHLIEDDSVTFTIEQESVRIVRDGRVIWTRRGLFTIFSPIDLTYYPFDRQYLRINLHNRQPTFKLKHQQTNSSTMNLPLSQSTGFWTKFFRDTDGNLDKKTLSNISFAVEENKPAVLLRGWFVQTLGIESRTDNDNVENLNIYILLQRRRESHIYSTILPTLFFSVFIFIFYFSSIESYQRLTINLLHLFATLMFIIYLDKRISAEQLGYTPLIIRYLSLVFLMEMLSLFFDHIIHSVYYGGAHFVSNWFRRNTDDAQSQYVRSSRVKLLRRAGHSEESMETERETDIFMKQLMEREEFLKGEDDQRYQWHKRARLSECICCWFFFVIILVVFLFLFFILPRLSLTKMT